MKLDGLLKKYDYEVLQGTVKTNVKRVAYHSGKVEKGDLFVCITGYAVDGHDYIPSALENGASALIVERDVVVPPEITVIKVNNSRMALARISSLYYNKPSKQFNLIGVTGTNGKTSTVFLIDHILKAYGKKTGLIGTIENRIGSQVIPTVNTTPESLDLQNLFADMVEANVSHVVMEVSSHALKLHRVKYAGFDVGIFTNLTQDHLDFHESMDAYAKAKSKLLKRAKVAVINRDDSYGAYMIRKAKGNQIITYGIRDTKADIFAYNIEQSITGNVFQLRYKALNYTVQTQTPGLFSVYNALAAIGGALAVDVPMEIIIQTLKNHSTIEGRYETIESKTGVYAIVDYAHTPDGLLNILTTTEGFKTKRVITVFGCGGDRDKTKRPQMGKIAGEHSDYAIITSDNPRTEAPNVIIDEIEVGMKETNCLYERIEDRKEAIEKALSIAEPGDIVVVAGKGHENYQIIGSTRNHFDDKEIINEFFEMKTE